MNYGRKEGRIKDGSMTMLCFLWSLMQGYVLAAPRNCINFSVYGRICSRFCKSLVVKEVWSGLTVRCSSMSLGGEGYLLLSWKKKCNRRRDRYMVKFRGIFLFCSVHRCALPGVLPGLPMLKANFRWKLEVSVTPCLGNRFMY